MTPPPPPPLIKKTTSQHASDASNYVPSNRLARFILAEFEFGKICPRQKICASVNPRRNFLLILVGNFWTGDSVGRDLLKKKFTIKNWFFNCYNDAKQFFLSQIERRSASTTEASIACHLQCPRSNQSSFSTRTAKDFSIIEISVWRYNEDMWPFSHPV